MAEVFRREEVRRPSLPCPSLESTRINSGESHENGVAEQAHFRLKDAIDQALMLRGSRDFSSLDEYTCFIKKVVDRRNRLVQEKLGQERPHLQLLPPSCHSGGGQLGYGRQVYVPWICWNCSGASSSAVGSRAHGPLFSALIGGMQYRSCEVVAFRRKKPPERFVSNTLKPSRTFSVRPFLLGMAVVVCSDIMYNRH